MAHEIAKLILKHGHKFLSLDEAVEAARTVSMPDEEIADYLIRCLQRLKFTKVQEI